MGSFHSVESLGSHFLSRSKKVSRKKSSGEANSVSKCPKRRIARDYGCHVPKRVIAMRRRNATTAQEIFETIKSQDRGNSKVILVSNQGEMGKYFSVMNR